MRRRLLRLSALTTKHVDTKPGEPSTAYLAVKEMIESTPHDERKPFLEALRVRAAGRVVDLHELGRLTSPPRQKLPTPAPAAMSG